MERVASPSTVRMIGHPYPRAKTPSSANASSSAVSSAAAAAALAGVPDGHLVWASRPSPLLLAPRPRLGRAWLRVLSLVSRLKTTLRSLRPCSCFCRVRYEARFGPGRYRQSLCHRRQIKDTAGHADEPMPASPPLQSRATSMDVERTPTKSKGHTVSFQLLPRTVPAAESTTIRSLVRLPPSVVCLLVRMTASTASHSRRHHPPRSASPQLPLPRQRSFPCHSLRLLQCPLRSPAASTRSPKTVPVAWISLWLQLPSLPPPVCPSLSRAVHLQAPPPAHPRLRHAPRCPRPAQAHRRAPQDGSPPPSAADVANPAQDDPQPL